MRPMSFPRLTLPDCTCANRLLGRCPGARRPMSALGQKRTSEGVKAMSAYPQKRTLELSHGMSALCQTRKFCVFVRLPSQHASSKDRRAIRVLTDSCCRLCRYLRLLQSPDRGARLDLSRQIFGKDRRIDFL